MRVTPWALGAGGRALGAGRGGRSGAEVFVSGRVYGRIRGITGT